MGATGLEPPQSPNFGSSGLQGVPVYSQIMGWLLPILLSISLCPNLEECEKGEFEA